MLKEGLNLHHAKQWNLLIRTLLHGLNRIVLLSFLHTLVISPCYRAGDIGLKKAQWVLYNWIIRYVHNHMCITGKPGNEHVAPHPEFGKTKLRRARGDPLGHIRRDYNLGVLRPVYSCQVMTTVHTPRVKGESIELTDTLKPNPNQTLTTALTGIQILTFSPTACIAMEKLQSIFFTVILRSLVCKLVEF
eukprot:sb/3471147/